MLNIELVTTLAISRPRSQSALVVSGYIVCEVHAHVMVL